MYRPGFITPHRGAQKPLWPFTLNTDSPLVAGLEACWMVAPAAGNASLYDLLQGNNCTDINGGTIKWVTGDNPNVGHGWALSTTTTVVPPTNITVSTFPVTVACWANYSSLATACWALTRRHSTTSSQGFYLGVATDGTPQWGLGASNTNGTSGAVTAGNWYLLAGLSRAANQHEVYVNGLLSGSGTTAGNGGTPNNTIIGGRHSGGVLVISGGMFDGVFVWNRALSASEIWQLYDPATRWSMFAPLSGRAYFVGGVTAQYLDPPRLTRAHSFGSPSLGLTLAPSCLARSHTFGAATLVPDQQLDAPRLSRGHTFGSATLLQVQELDAPALARSHTLGAHQLTLCLTAPLLARSHAFPAGHVAAFPVGMLLDATTYPVLTLALTTRPALTLNMRLFRP